MYGTETSRGAVWLADRACSRRVGSSISTVTADPATNLRSLAVTANALEWTSLGQSPSMHRVASDLRRLREGIDGVAHVQNHAGGAVHADVSEDKDMAVRIYNTTSIPRLSTGADACNASKANALQRMLQRRQRKG